ncbi:MAG: OmpA family protein [Polyangiales bacterium]
MTSRHARGANGCLALLALLSACASTAATRPADTTATPACEVPPRPRVDTDGDGRFDDEDQCPTDAMGPSPDPAHAGCPLPDRDNDSIPDVFDECPDAAGGVTDGRAPRGCSGPVLVGASDVMVASGMRLEGPRLRLDPPITLARERLTQPSEAMLRRVVEVMLAHPEIQRLRVVANVFDQRNAATNLSVSNRRAQLVLRFLTGAGLPAGRVEATGAGSTRPLVPGDSADARARNTRIELLVVTDREKR